MNEFASALSAALHEEAKEIAMSADMQHAERQLQESIRSVDRRRRVWMAVAAAAAILVVAAGITLGVKLPKAAPTTPNPTPSQSAKTIVFQANILTPPLNVALPHWIASADPSNYSGGYHFDQHNGDRAITLFSVDHMYPLGATKITHPGYAALVADWKAVQTHGYGNVNDVATTTVDAKPATTMTVRLTRGADGFAYCPDATDPANPDACAGVFPGRTYHLAIVDQGKAKPPTLFWESSTTDFTANAPNSSAAVASEFATWLATIRFR